MSSTATTHEGLDASRSSALACLTAEQQQRLTVILDGYLAALERSEPLSREVLLAEHPDLADALVRYFRSLEDLHDMAAGFAGERAADEPAPDQNVAGRIGDFELIRELGRGGMGVVHEARQVSLNRRVALKLLPFASVLEARQIARFKHEAQAAAQVQHPHIVPVYAVGLERGIHYYAMQLIDGQPLDRAIADLRERCPAASHRRTTARAVESYREANASRSPGPSLLSTATTRQDYYAQVVSLGMQAAEALHAAHEYGVVHRDIKPSNLLLEAGGKLWVTDFGLARIGRAASLTKTGDLVGTMRYMSPEQAAGHSTMVDHRTDIYSLGATLYELLTLQAAFTGESGPELLRQIENRDPPRLRQLRPDIPADLETVIQTAMARDRDERYATAQDFAADLRCVLAGQATNAQPLSVVDRMARWGRRHWRLAAAAAVALSIAVVALAVGGTVVVRQRALAASSARRVERHFRETREVLDRFGLDLSARLAEVPGAESVRRDLLLETAQYYRRCIQAAGSDAVVQCELAEAYGRLALVLDEVASAEESLAAHAQAVEVWTQVTADKPSDDAALRPLALCRNNYALALARSGQAQPACRELTLAIHLQRRLAKCRPRDGRVQLDLGTSLGNLGLVQQQMGRTTEAQASYREAIAIFSEDPPAGDAERSRKLAATLNNLASTHLSGQPHEAQALHQRALQLQVAAVRQQPDEPSLQREMALTLNNLGAAYARSRNLTKARECYRQAIDLEEQLLAHRPAELPYRRDLAVSLNNLGLALSRDGQLAAAETALRRSLALHADLVRELPGDAPALSSLASVHNNLGIVCEQSGQCAAARGQFASALQHQRAAYRTAPAQAGYRALAERHAANYERMQACLPGDPAANHSAATETAIAQRTAPTLDGDEL